MPRPRVLVVDDHEGFRSIARALLEGDGIEVAGEAATGELAVTAAVQLAPDIVLLDVHLPDLDGFEVSQQLALLPLYHRGSYSPRTARSPTCGGA